MSKFCHECGFKYPIADVKFCTECGMRRIVSWLSIFDHHVMLSKDNKLITNTTMKFTMFYINWEKWALSLTYK